MVTRAYAKASEAAWIRSKLQLRFNTLYNCYEVYTTTHGSGIFRWMQITDEVCEWYKKQFNLTVSSYIQPSSLSGGIIEHSIPKPTQEPL